MPDAALSPEALDLLGRLVGAQAQGEAAVQAMIAADLTAIGCRVSKHHYVPANVAARGEISSRHPQASHERIAIVALLPATAEGRQSLLLFAHPDCEPFADKASWTDDPLTLVNRGGRLHGWGVADDLAGCAAAILAMSRLAMMDAERGDVIFAAAPSKWSAKGTAAVLQNGLPADAALYLHPAESGAGMNEIKAITSGHLEFSITVQGKPPETQEPNHTVLSHKAVNAVDKAVVIHAALRALDIRRAARVHHPAIADAAGRSTNLIVSAMTTSPQAGLSRMAPDCTLGCALSFPPGERLVDVQAEVTATVAAAAAADDWLSVHPPQITWHAGTDAAEVSGDNPFWRVASEAVSQVTGSAPQVYPLHTGSDIRVPILEAGMVCLGLGCLCGDLTQNGRTDEWVDAADFARMVDVVTAIASEWCQGTSGAMA
jgi:acetylornithine deacetylase